VQNNKVIIFEIYIKQLNETIQCKTTKTIMTMLTVTVLHARVPPF